MKRQLSVVNETGEHTTQRPAKSLLKATFAQKEPDDIADQSENSEKMEDQQLESSHSEGYFKVERDDTGYQNFQPFEIPVVCTILKRKGNQYKKLKKQLPVRRDCADVRDLVRKAWVKGIRKIEEGAKTGNPLIKSIRPREVDFMAKAVCLTDIYQHPEREKLKLWLVKTLESSVGLYQFSNQDYEEAYDQLIRTRNTFEFPEDNLKLSMPDTKNQVARRIVSLFKKWRNHYSDYLPELQKEFPEQDFNNPRKIYRILVGIMRVGVKSFITFMDSQVIRKQLSHSEHQLDRLLKVDNYALAQKTLAHLPGQEESVIIKHELMTFGTHNERGVSLKRVRSIVGFLLDCIKVRILKGQAIIDTKSPSNKLMSNEGEITEETELQVLQSLLNEGNAIENILTITGKTYRAAQNIVKKIYRQQIREIELYQTRQAKKTDQKNTHSRTFFKKIEYYCSLLMRKDAVYDMARAKLRKMLLHARINKKQGIEICEEDMDIMLKAYLQFKNEVDADEPCLTSLHLAKSKRLCDWSQVYQKQMYRLYVTERKTPTPLSISLTLKEKFPEGSNKFQPEIVLNKLALKVQLGLQNCPMQNQSQRASKLANYDLIEKWMQSRKVPLVSKRVLLSISQGVQSSQLRVEQALNSLELFLSSSEGKRITKRNVLKGVKRTQEPQSQSENFQQDQQELMGERSEQKNNNQEEHINFQEYKT